MLDVARPEIADKVRCTLPAPFEAVKLSDANDAFAELAKTLKFNCNLHFENVIGTDVGISGGSCCAAVAIAEPPLVAAITAQVAMIVDESAGSSALGAGNGSDASTSSSPTSSINNAAAQAPARPRYDRAGIPGHGFAVAYGNSRISVTGLDNESSYDPGRDRQPMSLSGCEEHAEQNAILTAVNSGHTFFNFGGVDHLYVQLPPCVNWS